MPLDKLPGFQRLPGYDLNVPIQQFPVAPAPPVAPTAAILAHLGDSVADAIQNNSPAAKAERAAKLAKAQSELRNIPLMDALSADIYKNARDTDNFNVRQSVGPNGPSLSVEPISPEYKAAGAGLPTTVYPGLAPQGNANEAAPLPQLETPDLPPISPEQKTTAPPITAEQIATSTPGGKELTGIPVASQSTVGGAPVPTSPNTAVSAADLKAGPATIVPNFDEPPPTPLGYRPTGRAGDAWTFVNREGKEKTIQNKWQRVQEYDPDQKAMVEVWVDSGDPRKRYYPNTLSKPAPTSPEAQAVNQIGRQMNTNPTLRAFNTSLTRYQQVASNAAKPFDQRDATDDAALILAHSGIETPNQAVTNEQVKLAQETASWKDWVQIKASEFTNHPRLLSDRQGSSFLQGDHRAADEARLVSQDAIKPYMERAESINAVKKVLGVDPAQPLKTVEPGSGKWNLSHDPAVAPAAPDPTAAPAQKTVAPTTNPAQLYQMAVDTLRVTPNDPKAKAVIDRLRQLGQLPIPSPSGTAVNTGTTG